MRSNLKPAVFLDRDGTIIEDRGHLRMPSEVVFYPDTARALRQLQDHFRLFVVTHQPGISGGIVSVEEVARVNDHVVAELRRHGVVISAVYCCPHRRDEQCACIKPRPFFLEKAAGEHGLDLTRSFVVGDHPHDVALAENAGATGVYVLTGHGARHRAELSGCKAVVPGIHEAADWILAYRAMQSREDETHGERKAMGSQGTRHVAAKRLFVLQAAVLIHMCLDWTDKVRDAARTGHRHRPAGRSSVAVGDPLDARLRTGEPAILQDGTGRSSYATLWPGGVGREKQGTTRGRDQRGDRQVRAGIHGARA